jgi:hypothetical protein
MLPVPGPSGWSPIGAASVSLPAVQLSVLSCQLSEALLPGLCAEAGNTLVGLVAQLVRAHA